MKNYVTLLLIKTLPYAILKKGRDKVMKMTKKEIVEYLKQNMPDFQGTEEEIEVKKALYIYVELGKMKSFDERYYFGNSETQRKIYDLAERQERNVDKIAGQRKLICVSLTHLYCSILKEFGIYAMASTPEEGGHIYPIVMTKSKKAFIADLQLDLENIQTKSRLEHFEYMGDLPRNRGVNSDQATLTKMLIEMRYIKDEKDYKNEEIERLAEQVRDMYPHEALRTVLEDEELYCGNEDMESIEANKFYRRVLRRVIPHFFETKVFAFNCYKEREEGERDYTLCVFSEEDTMKPYIFSKKDRRFLSVGIPKMKELEEGGLKFGVRPKEKGINKLKNI